MKKYEIQKSTIETRFNISKIKSGITNGEDSEIVASFESEAEAKAAFKNYKSKIDVFKSFHTGWRMMDITEYQLAKVEYDKDGEFQEEEILDASDFDPGDLLEFMNHKITFRSERSEEPITIIVDCDCDFEYYVDRYIDREEYDFEVINGNEIEITTVDGKHYDRYTVISIEPTAEYTTD